MRIRPTGCVAVVLVLGLMPGRGVAQDPQPPAAGWPYPPEFTRPTPGAAVPVALAERVVVIEELPPAPAVAPGQQHWVAVNLSVLQPSLGRVQVKVWPRPNNSVWAEVYGGSVLFDGMYGFGARVQHSAWCPGNADVVMVSPGLGLHIVPHWYSTDHRAYVDQYGYWVGQDSQYTTLYFLAGDVDVSWLHDFSPRFGFELGLKVGLAGRLAGRVGDDYPSGLMWGRNVYPIFSLYSGLRF
jgi:hypothetical protein